jgi:hypothetical protein
MPPLVVPPEHRAACLEKACDDLAQLRQRVEALLQVNQQASAFMSQPAAPRPNVMRDARPPQPCVEWK